MQDRARKKALFVIVPLAEWLVNHMNADQTKIKVRTLCSLLSLQSCSGSVLFFSYAGIVWVTFDGKTKGISMVGIMTHFCTSHKFELESIKVASNENAATLEVMESFLQCCRLHNSIYMCTYNSIYHST